MSKSRFAPIVPALTLAMGGLLFSVNLSVAAPLSSASSAGQEDPAKKTLRQRQFKSLAEAIDRADEELETDYAYGVAVLVYTIRTPDDQTMPIRTELRSIGNAGGGYIPGKASTNEAVVRPVFVRKSTRPVALHILAPGFDRYIRRVILHPGELVVWEDIVLEPMTNRSTASLVGHVRLEDDDEELEGMVIYIDQEAVAFTDASGRFEVDPVRAGKLRVSTHKSGYLGMNAEVKVAAGDLERCELVGYRKRFARVRWAYQPDGTRNFDGAMPTGTAVLSTRKLSRVSFAKGFQQINSRSDFLISQVDDQLVLRHFDMRSGKSPASILIKDTQFDEVYEAPESGYAQSETPLRPGDIYVFRCYDGKHYAMMEVLEITDEAPSPNRP